MQRKQRGNASAAAHRRLLRNFHFRWVCRSVMHFCVACVTAIARSIVLARWHLLLSPPSNFLANFHFRNSRHKQQFYSSSGRSCFVATYMDWWQCEGGFLVRVVPRVSSSHHVVLTAGWAQKEKENSESRWEKIIQSDDAGVSIRVYFMPEMRRTG